MSDDEMLATVNYCGNGFYIGTSPSGHAQVMDVDHDRSAAATPVELLLIALGGCTAVDVVSILKKRREELIDYKVEVRGSRRDEHPRSYNRMEVRHILTGKGLSRESVAKAIELSETKYCSVAATFRPTVEITSTFEIIEAV